MPPQNMQPTDNKQIVQRFMDECWNQGNLNTVMELVANDCRYHDPVFPSLTSGAENIKNHIQTCRGGFPDLMFTIDDTIAERDEVVVHWTATGTHKGQFLGMPPTNKKASVTGTSINRIEGSKIGVFCDFATSESGDNCVELYAQAKQVTFKEALHACADWLGVPVTNTAMSNGERPKPAPLKPFPTDDDLLSVAECRRAVRSPTAYLNC